ncbi:acid-sensing ion channel 1A-like [Haliotis cracherodii]|uniref:acid-sensing ion channel 1A-like n=1 Tax=Haliotis cracherodii TaxID=6455 RepID=UPI0039ECCB53
MNVDKNMTDTTTADARKHAPTYGLKDLWDEFSHSTGIHAVEKIKAPSINPFSVRGLMWTLAICTTTAFLIYNLIEELGNYYSYPIVTKVTSNIKHFIEFPAVTICNRCTLNKTRLDVYPEMEAYFANTSLQRNRNFTFPTPTSDVFQNPLSLEWWRNMSMEGSKMLVQCAFGGDNFDCMTEFRPVFTTQGLCHSYNFNVTEIVKVWTAGDDANLIVTFNIYQDDYTFRANMAAGIKVLLHHPRLHPEADPTVVMASPGFSTYVALQKKEYSFLPGPYMAFDDMECVDTTSTTFVNPLKYYSPYTYEHCFMECVRIKAFDECGCVGPSDPQDLPRCSLVKQDSCYMAFVREMSKNGTFVKECGCFGECTLIRYTAQVSSSSFPANIWVNSFLNSTETRDRATMVENLLELRVFYDNMMVTSTAQQPQYTVASLFSNIGGQMGLCLGASNLTIMEITELLVFIILYLCDKCRGRKARNRINTW